jgi:hypothetical protein
MTEPKKAEASDYSMQNAMNKLAEIGIIISREKQILFMKKPEEVDDAYLLKVAESLARCTILFTDVFDQWNGSESKGFDAIQKSKDLGERIDIKLYNTGKLEFEQMKKIMARLNRIDDALLLEEVMTPFLTKYAYFCREKKNYQALYFCSSFSTDFVEVFKKHLINEKNRLGNQVERCNLYYQAKLNTRTVTIAWAALGVSVLSILATIVLAIFK